MIKKKNTENHWSKLLLLQTSLKSIIFHVAFLTENIIPWLFTHFYKLLRFSLTFNKIPWLFTHCGNPESLFRRDTGMFEWRAFKIFLQLFCAHTCSTLKPCSVSPLLTGVPCGCEGEEVAAAGSEATEGGAEPCEGGCCCCWSSLPAGSVASPALIDSITASTSSAVGNSFSVGDGTRPVKRINNDHFYSGMYSKCNAQKTAKTKPQRWSEIKGTALAILQVNGIWSKIYRQK